MGSISERAFALLKESGTSLRSAEIAGVLGIDARYVVPSLQPLVDSGALVACDVYQGDMKKQKEYRLSANGGTPISEDKPRVPGRKNGQGQGRKNGRFMGKKPENVNPAPQASELEAAVEAAPPPPEPKLAIVVADWSDGGVSIRWGANTGHERHLAGAVDLSSSEADLLYRLLEKREMRRKAGM